MKPVIDEDEALEGHLMRTVHTMRSMPNSVGFWRRNRAESLRLTVYCLTPPADPEQAGFLAQCQEELAGLQRREDAVKARYERRYRLCLVC